MCPDFIKGFHFKRDLTEIGHLCSTDYKSVQNPPIGKKMHKLNLFNMETFARVSCISDVSLKKSQVSDSLITVT